MEKWLLDIIACPKCKGRLKNEEESKKRFVCDACKLAFPVVGDMPDFLLDDAEKI